MTDAVELSVEVIYAMAHGDYLTWCKSKWQLIFRNVQA